MCFYTKIIVPKCPLLLLLPSVIILYITYIVNPSLYLTSVHSFEEYKVSHICIFLIVNKPALQFRYHRVH